MNEEIPRCFGAEHGVVVQNDDPEGLYRCRLKVLGKIALTDWAFPLIGGGSPQRGGGFVPAVGADVVVFFLGGDLERPLYVPAWWGKPKGQSEMPEPARAAGAEAHLVQSLQIGKLCISVDERPGQRKFVVEDLETEDALVWDLEKKGCKIKMTSAVIIDCDGLVRINGTQVTIQDRLVQIVGKPM